MPNNRQPLPPGRDPRIDFWRGLCVVGMASWHLLTNTAGVEPAPFPGWLSFPVIQGFNFVAEGFVLVAGLSVGIVVARMPERPIRAAHYAGRALQLLLVHYALVAVVLLGFTPSELPGWFAAQSTPGKVLSVLTLQYQPYLADILSVFVFLFLAAPVLLALRRARGDAALVAVSVALYLAANLLPWLATPRWQQALELNSGGAFDFGSWQLVFAVGIVLGGRHPAWIARPAASFRRTLALAAAGFVVAGIYRLGILVGGGISDELRELLLNRHPLTPIRLVYIALEMFLIALLTVRFWEPLGRLRVVRAVVAVGRHSLTVFSVSVVLDYALKALLGQFGVGFPASLTVWAVDLAALVLLAVLLDAWRRARRAARPVPPAAQ